MKKTILVLISIFLFSASLAACSDNEEKLEKLQRTIDYTEGEIQDAQNKIDRLNELRDEYDAMKEKLGRLTIGTAEYKKAIEENNRLVNQIVMEFPEMKPYVTEIK